MASQSSINKTILPNGIRILSESVPYVDSVSVGVWAVAGARDEDHAHHGMSHFIEHMLFKGTASRTARQIADEMDSLGGHLNAFTDKEFYLLLRQGPWRAFTEGAGCRFRYGAQLAARSGRDRP